MSRLIEHTTKCLEIRIAGAVQGVGFRPFVYRLAMRYEVKGWVRNDASGVTILAQGDEIVLRQFCRALEEEAPPLARIDSVAIQSTIGKCPRFRTFKIVASDAEQQKTVSITPDGHVCADCLREMFASDDRRHRYPFINCTNCGPRFSIVRDIPYDRKWTTMSSFEMCTRCQAEYDDPLDRRYHAQPNACPSCGPRLYCADASGAKWEGTAALDRIIAALLAGQCVAVKSVGGFHLAVDASNEQAVLRLRQRKKRDHKAFAVMVRSLEYARSLAEISEKEGQWLESPARPIVLVRRRPKALSDRIAPQNPNIGVMLPSAPLHYLLVEPQSLGAIVMTSGNISGMPIAYRDEDALRDLFEVADLVLYHDREIETRVDDSVLRISEHPRLDRELVSFLRRSRGYAPSPVLSRETGISGFAYGAELKTTVTVADGRQVFMSPHIGDLKNDETFRSQLDAIRHLQRLYEIKPQFAACDLHPAFRSTRFLKESQMQGAANSLILVQHHHAHMAACMAENGISGPALGIILDGAGYGLDGTIWGGEVFVGDLAQFERVAHLRPLRLLGGDKAVREPIRTAYFLLSESGQSGALDTILGDALNEDETRVFAHMTQRGLHSPWASSMGRLFDGVAALLNVCRVAEYEAHGPIALEGLLERNLECDHAYAFPWREDAKSGLKQLDYAPLISDIVLDVSNQVPVATISRRFHSAVVQAVIDIAKDMTKAFGLEHVVLSGGVFLNEFLLVNCVLGLRDAGLIVHTHRNVPCNDGGISLGQMVVAQQRVLRSQQEEAVKSESYVCP